MVDISEEVAMRRSWSAWASVLALCVSPALAQARDRGRDGADARERHPSPGRHADRSNPRSDHSGREARNVDRGRNSRDGRGSGWNTAWSGDRRDQRQWRGSYRSEPRHGSPSYRNGFHSYGYRPRYPAYYPHGYFYVHGYYFPRYYFDYNIYPTPASIRMLVQPSETEVYVDGYYAGVVDAFDGLFQRLRVAPGPHQVTLRLDGYQTWSAEVYAPSDGTLEVRHDMLPGPSGENGAEYGPNPGDAGPGADEGPDPYDEPPPQQQ